MNDLRIYEINDLSNQKVLNILKSGITEYMFDNTTLAENYLYSQRDKSSNLFYILDHGRYQIGKYFVITDQQDNFIASAGWNHYSNDTALVLTRMIVHPRYRTQFIIGSEILPKIIEQTSSYNKVWITANNYNKSIYHWFERASQKKSTALHKDWPEIYKRFKPIGQHLVHHTLQWVVQLEK
jgi:N-acetylglutamate synthase-like GNAT family acetyltransferase